MRKLIVALLLVVSLVAGGCSPALSPTGSNNTTSDNLTDWVDSENTTWLYEGIAVDCGLDFETFRTQVLLNVGDDMVYYEFEELEMEEDGLSRYWYEVETAREVEFLEGLGKFEEEVVLLGEPPEDRTWISPGKVQIGNFFPGGRVEYPILVHNGNDSAASFAVVYRRPDHIATGFLRAPSDITQRWIVIADTTPVLAPRETREILITLEMPEELDDNQARFCQVTPEGLDWISDTRERLTLQITEDLIAQGNSIEEVELVIAGEVNKKLLSIPEASFLVYLGSQGSVSYQLIYRERPVNIGWLVEEVAERGHIAIGDLREDQWEFWISVMDTTQTGQVKTELCCRWLVTMRA